jgi:DNA-binding MarR family transcriptional regulator
MQELMFSGEGHGRMHQMCAAAGVPPSMVKALTTLSADKPRAMRDLAERWGCDASYVTALIDGLEERGLAERRPHPTDRRVKTIVLTPAGADAKARVQAILWRPPASFSVLDEGELVELCSLLRKVAAADPVLAADGALASSRSSQ